MSNDLLEAPAKIYVNLGGVRRYTVAIFLTVMWVIWLGSDRNIESSAIRYPTKSSLSESLCIRELNIHPHSADPGFVSLLYKEI